MVATFKISSKITFSILFIEDSLYTSIFTDIHMMTILPNLPNGGWGVWTLGLFWRQPTSERRGLFWRWRRKSLSFNLFTLVMTSKHEETSLCSVLCGKILSALHLQGQVLVSASALPGSKFSSLICKCMSMLSCLVIGRKQALIADSAKTHGPITEIYVFRRSLG